MNNYNSLAVAISELQSQGYTEDFNLKQNCLECRNGSYKVFHDEFVIDQVFRFEENTDPGDQAILYAISSPKHHLKGLLVNGYGIYTEGITNEMAEKLHY